MLNNYINVYDIIKLKNKLIRKSGLTKIFSKKLFVKDVEKVKSTWSKIDHSAKAWWDIEELQKRNNLLVSGDSEIDHFQYIKNSFFGEKNNLTGISLGCGTGKVEQKWAETGIFKRLDAYDISENRILYAKKNNRYPDIVNYDVSDVFNVPDSGNKYDIVIFEGSLHHFSPVKKIINKAYEYLNDSGVLIINEYVGPNRFQWTDNQLKKMNALLELIPQKYKIQESDGKVKTRIIKTSILSMKLYDPSEAIESDSILPEIEKLFNTVIIKKYGMTLLPSLLNDIAHNFIDLNQETEKILKLCFAVEEMLIDNDEINSDHIIGVFNKKKKKITYTGH